jgi:CO dehydrogenase/acetyl-CoA synthase beta subunit
MSKTQSAEPLDIRKLANLEGQWTELVWRDKSLQDFVVAYYGYDLIERDTTEYNLAHYKNLAEKLGQQLAKINKKVKAEEEQIETYLPVQDPLV